MDQPEITLQDRFDLTKPQVLLNGTQALVRLMLMQKERDRQAGLNTAGYVTGYRGSPLGAVDMWMERTKSALTPNDITFQAGLNEDLAATAIWGSQQAELRGEGLFEGVFGLWYGKGPGVDRSGDVMRHANMAGTSAKGGVLMAMGDDHTGESSTVLHQSDWAMVDAFMPVLSPAGVQEILDFGVYGYELSRFAGVWAGLKLMKDTVEVTSVVDGRADRMTLVTPDFDMPDGGLNIRLIDERIAQEARMIDHKIRAAQAYARANKIDRQVWGTAGAKIGFVAAGENWLDLVHALGLLGLDQAACENLGLCTYKIGQTYPLDVVSFNEWAEDLDLIIVIEEKRKLIEGQIKDALFDNRNGRRVYGEHKVVSQGSQREELFSTKYALEPFGIAQKLAGILIEEGCGSEGLRASLAQLTAASTPDNTPDIVQRLPYFCAGCPHNTSTKLPEGARAYAGIGCHFMAQWMGRETTGFTHMGGEGANWIGESVFSKTPHVFQNIGDGTYNHSGLQAIRASVAANVSMTYKILYNDAVAMTGGQVNEGGLDAARIACEVSAIGVSRIFVVYDDKEDLNLSDFPKGIRFRKREALLQVEEECRKIKGVSVLLYIQTCAAEKRRRRKRGTFPDPDKRVFINPDICEGCGDCGVQSNCVAIVPLETELGRKRAIDQSSCNKDYSCVNGFCPSFVTVTGGTLKKAAMVELDLPDLPHPKIAQINGTYNTVITGVGGTGVVTIGAILAQAGHIDGKGVAMMEMAGLAQKGGAVTVHLRLAKAPQDISAIRVALGECDALIGCDLVVSAGHATLGLTTTGKTGGVVDSHQTFTGEFTQQTDFALPADRLQMSLKARLREKLHMFDASALSRVLMGDSLFSNMMVLGASWQAGFVPISYEALMRAIDLNGQACDRNKRAFELGRWAVLYPAQAESFITGKEPSKSASTLAEKIEFRANHLRDYQDQALADRYVEFVKNVPEILREDVAVSYHKLLSYKDEYEVARLLTQTRAQAAQTFDGTLKLSFHLAPPIMWGRDPNGRPKKRQFGAWFEYVVPWLARLKKLRATWVDPFGYTEERCQERRLITQYEDDLNTVIARLQDQDIPLIKELAALPQSLRGFGPVKVKNIATFDAERRRILAALNQR